MTSHPSSEGADASRARPPILDDEARAALRQEAAATPEWAPWLAMVEASLAAADSPAWRATVVRFPTAREADAPLLDGARIGVDAEAAGALLGELVSGSAALAGADPLALLEAGIRGEPGRLAGLAGRWGVPASLLAAVGHHLSQPVLLEAARRSEAMRPASWSSGWCPVCGGRPVLAELRGLDRSRVLRCGRCAASWARDVLHCAFCEERDHRRQGSLVPAEGGELLRIETCDGCRGYLKVVTTLRARPVASLPLDDLRSMPLELVAVERGYRRPEGPGRAPGVAVSPRSAVSAG